MMMVERRGGSNLLTRPSSPSSSCPFVVHRFNLNVNGAKHKHTNQTRWTDGSNRFDKNPVRIVFESCHVEGITNVTRVILPDPAHVRLLDF